MKASLSITNSRSLLRLMPLSRWCHPAISSSVVPFCSCPQSLPASGSFPTSQLFASGDQSIGVSASASVLPMNTQDWSPLGWTGWMCLQSKGVSKKKKSSVICTYGPIILRVNMVPSLFKKKFFIWLCQVLAVACDMNLVPWTVVRPDLLHWECRVLATGPLGKSYLLRFY